MEKITAVMVGEANVEVESIQGCCENFVTAEEIGVLRDVSLEMAKGARMKLEFELGKFLVRFGDDYVWGYYPYFTSEGWIDCENYEKFYFGGLLMKTEGGDWYTAPWIDPDANSYALVEMIRVDDLNAAIYWAIDRAVDDYRKKAW